MTYESYSAAMWASAPGSDSYLPPVPVQTARAPRIATITYYGCKEYLRRRGFITEGELVFHRLDATPLTIAAIQIHVAEYFGIPLAEMTSARRAREVARPRQVAMYLAKQLTPRSLREIGRRFGGRDHTTVIHAVRQTEKLSKADAEMAADVALLTSELIAKSAPSWNGAPVQ